MFRCFDRLQHYGYCDGLYWMDTCGYRYPIECNSSSLNDVKEFEIFEIRFRHIFQILANISNGREWLAEKIVDCVIYNKCWKINL